MESRLVEAFRAQTEDLSLAASDESFGLKSSPAHPKQSNL